MTSSWQMDDKELERLREDIEAAVLVTLPACHILEVTQTSDGQGGITEAWGTAVYNAPYRLDPVRGTEQIAGAQLKPYHNYWLSLGHGITVTEYNRVKIDDVSYTVIGVDDNKTWQGAVRTLVERI